MENKKKYCNKCGEELINCDGGYGHDFEFGEFIFCHKKKGEHFHYCDRDELQENKVSGRTAIVTERQKQKDAIDSVKEDKSVQGEKK